jgi:outer membrane protein assembly factor BamA
VKVGKLLVFLIFTSILFSGCLGTRYLKPNEDLLYKQKIVTSKSVDAELLEELYAQSPNRQFPIIPVSPYVWFYEAGIKKYDVDALHIKKEHLLAEYDSLIALSPNQKQQQKLLNKKNRKSLKIDKIIKEGNVLMRWGEPLAIYDSNLTANTIQKFKLSLNARGYFDNQVDHTIKQNGKFVRSIYNVKEGAPYLIDTTMVQIKDSLVANVLKKRATEIKTPDNYNQSTLTTERDGINEFLKNNGYYNFSREYVSFDIDTAYGDHRVAIRTVLKNPISSNQHHQFTIDSVNFIINEATPNQNDSVLFSQNFNGTQYTAQTPFYKPKIIHRRVFLHAGDLYSKQNTFDTQRQLANFDVFKFINVNYDSTGGRFIANIFTQPLPRYQWTNEFGINVSQGFPGPFYNSTFKKRNIFRGLENFEISGRVGMEGVAPATEVDDIYRSIEAGINAALIFPKFILPIRSKTQGKFGHLNPKTKLSLGYSLTDRPEYNRKNANFTTTYSWGKALNTIYNLSLADVSIIDSKLSEDFTTRLETLQDNGSNLINAFKPSFVSSMSFFVIKNFNNYGLAKHNSSYLQLFLESGGTSQNIFSTTALDNQGLETYKFLKFNADYRKVSPISKTAGVAFRLNAGLALPYGSNEILPYEKYFFAGGSNGIRGWRPRRLGPGSYSPLNADGAISYQFEQSGEILIQASVEFRRNLFGFVDWAYFVDAGNIWTINEDNTRPGAQFSGDRFFKEIAVASGLGLRFDFVFLIMRFDAGLKVYDPARPDGKRFIFSNGFNDAPFDIKSNTEPIIFNIGIGYPF